MRFSSQISGFKAPVGSAGFCGIDGFNLMVVLAGIGAPRLKYLLRNFAFRLLRISSALDAGKAFRNARARQGRWIAG
jgi:hypothetical protein